MIARLNRIYTSCPLCQKCRCFFFNVSIHFFVFCGFFFKSGISPLSILLKLKQNLLSPCFVETKNLWRVLYTVFFFFLPVWYFDYPWMWLQWKRVKTEGCVLFRIQQGTSVFMMESLRFVFKQSCWDWQHYVNWLLTLFILFRQEVILSHQGKHCLQSPTCSKSWHTN